MTIEIKNKAIGKLPNSFAKPKEGETAHNDNRELHDTELENELIMTLLHQTQEDLEQATYTIIKKEKEIKDLKSRIHKFTNKNPDFWEADTIEANVAKNTSSTTDIQWTVKNSFLGDILHSSLHFETSYANGITGIIFQRDGTSDLTHFKTEKTSQNLVCLPVSGAFTSDANSVISALGASDWKTLNLLIPKIIKLIKNKTLKNIPNETSTDTLNGLIKLSSIIKSWPNLLRYDSIKLMGTVDTPEYQALDIQLENLEVNSKFIPLLSYRLSSVNEADKEFGQYPRLEFFETSRNNFEKWFVESDDVRGKRLELRFAEPDQMDVAVWQKLSDHDRLLIAATISKLPETISKIRGLNRNDARWEDWIKIANMVKTTLTNTLNKK